MANKGDTVHMAMEIVGTEKRDVTWKFNGKRFAVADVCGYPSQVIHHTASPEAFCNFNTHIPKHTHSNSFMGSEVGSVVDMQKACW